MYNSRLSENYTYSLVGKIPLMVRLYTNTQLTTWGATAYPCTCQPQFLKNETILRATLIFFLLFRLRYAQHTPHRNGMLWKNRTPTRSPCLRADFKCQVPTLAYFVLPVLVHYTSDVLRRWIWVVCMVCAKCTYEVFVLQEGINVCTLGVYAICWHNVVPCGLEEGIGGGGVL